MISLVVPVVFAVMDRLGGNGYKWVRRFGIPLMVWMLNPTLAQIPLSITMAVVYTFNLDEIEEKDYESIFTHGCAVSLGVCLLGGGWVVSIPIVWTVLTYASLRWNKFDWMYVELGRGFVTGLCCIL